MDVTDFQVMYGGRAIDSFDRRILTVYMDEYLGDFLFDTFQVFHFYKSDTIDYKIPAGKGKDDFVGKKCFSYYIKKDSLPPVYIVSIHPCWV